MKKTGEVLGHPLWMMPVMLLALIAMIEGMHTAAHIRMKIDADAYCRNGKLLDHKVKADEAVAHAD